MRKRAQKQHAKRNVLILTGAAFTLLALIVMARFHRPDPLIGPESDDMIARRGAEQNTCPQLLEIARSIPQRPLNGKVRRGNPVSQALRADRDDDDPELLEYLASTRDLSESVRPTLDSGYYLCPAIATLKENDDNLVKFSVLCNLMNAQMLQAQRENRAEDVVSLMLTNIQLGKTIVSDGPFVNLSVGAWIADRACKAGAILPWDQYSDELLRRVWDELDKQGDNPPTHVQAIEWEFRLIEQGVLFRSADGAGGRLGLLALKKAIRKHGDILHGMFTGPYAKDAEREDISNNLLFLEKAFFPTGIFHSARATAKMLRSSESSHLALRVLLALEMFKRKHGGYPQTLEELIPDYFAAPLLGPASGKPFGYSRSGKTFRFYSFGKDMKDDNGDSRKDTLFPGSAAKDFRIDLGLAP